MKATPSPKQKEAIRKLQAVEAIMEEAGLVLTVVGTTPSVFTVHQYHEAMTRGTIDVDGSLMVDGKAIEPLQELDELVFKP